MRLISDISGDAGVITGQTSSIEIPLLMLGEVPFTGPNSSVFLRHIPVVHRLTLSN